MSDKKTAVITDSNSGIFATEGKEKGIFVVPMPVVLDTTSYYEGVDISHEMLCDRLSKGLPAATSQPSPADVTGAWKEAFKAGYDEVIYIPMSSGLSSSYETAAALAKDFEGKVFVADNKRVAVTQRHSVEDALRYRDNGADAREIQERLEASAADSIIYIGVETLKYLKANGRVTPAGAAIGTLLGIRPLLVIAGDKLDAFAKVRGTKNCMQREIEAMRDYYDNVPKEGKRIRLSSAGSFADPEDARKWHSMVQEAFPDEEVDYDPLTFSICCHVGLDAFGMGMSLVPES